MTPPLEGVRVLDLTRLLPGPFCTNLLVQMGAEVLKVEDTAAGDYLRWSPPTYEGEEPSSASALFQALNSGKRSIRLNLKDEAGCEVLRKLVREYDILIESFRPGVLDRLGVGYEQLKAENESLIFCSVTGYGQTGPLKDRAGHDMNYLARTGLLGLTGEVDGLPVQSAAQIADLGGGASMACLGILAALFERERNGVGRFIDISMADGALSWLALDAARYSATGDSPQRGGLPLAGSLVCYRPYRCRDGFVALGALEPKFWKTFLAGIGREDLLEGQFEPPGSETHKELETIFLARSRDEWETFGDEHECCLDPVLGLDEALESDHVKQRGMIDPGQRGLGNPIQLIPSDSADPRSAAALGGDTDDVLSSLGYSADEIEQLIVEGSVARETEPPNTRFLG